MKNLIDTIKNIWRIEELRNRILITLGLLLVYRIGKRAEVEGTPQILGMVEKVHHLVTVTKA